MAYYQKYLPGFGGSSTTNVQPMNTHDIIPNPGIASGQGSIASRDRFYEYMRQYYNNTVFDDATHWLKYKTKHQLYKYSRSIFNPVKRLVDFYVDHIYPGIFPHPTGKLPPGVADALPMSEETSLEMRAAVLQVVQWSNWQVGQTVMVNYGSLTGNCLVEVIDDVARGKVRFDPVWSSYVKDVKLDRYGNLEAYAIEYQAFDASQQTFYTFRKEVDYSYITIRRNSEILSKTANPYPFIPAIWVKHNDNGSDSGMPAITCMAKLDELNSLFSHTNDHAHKQINSPRVLWSNSTVKPLFGDQNADSEDEFDMRKDTVFFKGMANGSTDTLVGNLDPATIIPAVAQMLDEIKADHPELTMYDKLRDQNIVSAPGAKLLMGDVEKRVRRAATAYDAASVRLFQMAVAIGGWRLSNGDWTYGGLRQITPQQSRFRGFDFESYQKGDLDMTLLPRPLIPETTRDVADELEIRARAVAQVAEYVPLAQKYRMLGIPEEKISALVSEQEKEEADRQAQQMAQAEQTAKIAAANKPAPAKQGA